MTSTLEIQEKVKKIYDDMIRSEVDPRNDWEYILSKMQVDYRLLNKVNSKDRAILNIGCGFPIDEIYLAPRIGRWASIDISPETVKKAKILSTYELPEHFSRKYSFIEADSAELPFNDESFDVVLSFSTIDHIPGRAKRKSVCSEIFRVTRRGGYSIVTVPNRLSVFYSIRSKRKQKEDFRSWYEYCFTPLELKKLLMRAGFEIVDFASTMSGNTGARGPIIGPVVGTVERRILQYFGTRMGYLCRKPKEKET
jgi:SAM-dependent methyltransferase